LRSEEDAEDAFQATFLVLARKAGAIRKRQSLASWLHGVALRAAWNARKSAMRRRHRATAVAAAPQKESEQPVTEAALREVQAILDEEVQRLPEKLRAPFVLCCLEGKSKAEAARVLNWKEGTVSGRLAQARERLRDRLTRRGVSLPAARCALAVTSEATAGLPAAVVTATTQAAIRFLASGGEGTSAILATQTLLGMAGGKIKATALVLLSLLAASAIGYPLTAVCVRHEHNAETRTEQQKADSQQPKTDLQGDPLPPEAIARLGTHRFWCGSTGIQVAYSLDGARILVANWGSVHVIDAATGKQLRQIRPVGDAGINSISLSPDGKLLAIGTDSHTKEVESNIQILDMQNRRLLRQCKDAGRQQYLGVRFSPDGKLLASYSYPSKTVYLWDPATAQELRRWPVNCETSSCFAFSRDSKTLIVGDRSTIHFWNVATGTEARRIEGHPGVVYQLALSPDGKTLASRGLKREIQVGEHERDNKLCLWDTTTGEKLHQIEVVPESTRQARRVPDVASAITYHDFSPDGKCLVTASGDGIVRVWDPASGKELRRWDTVGWAGAFAISPNGKTLASLGTGHTVRLWDPATGKELREHPGHYQGFNFLALSRDGKALASGGWDCDVRLWDTATGRPVRRVGTGDDLKRPLCFSRDGRLLTTISEDNRVQVWDVATGKELRQFNAPLEGHTRHHVVSPDGMTCASDSEERHGQVTKAKIVLWSMDTGKKLNELTADDGWIGALAFADNGRTLYSWGWEKKVRIWDVATAKLQREFSAGLRQCYTGKFSPDGKWFVCKSRQEGIMLYNLALGGERYRFKITGMDHADYPGLAFSPDGRTLAVGDVAGTIHLAELATGKIRHRLTDGHRAGIAALVFSADGERLISGSEDTTALVWDVTGRRSAKREALMPADLGACWNDLASDDAPRGYQAMRILVLSPADAVTVLAAHLHPAAAPDAKRIDKLIANLDSETFATRDAATKDLAQLVDLAEPALRRALDSGPTAESRRRIEQLLANLESLGTTGERLRASRAIEALERIGTPEALELLAVLSKGAPGAGLTREAKAALERLQRRQPAP
jgi:RNA polymerase sigma factor (sigma-70 family)